MKPNLKLRNIIFLSGMTQKEVCQRAKVREGDLSRAIRGKLVFLNPEKVRVAEVLGKAVQELFPE